MVTVERFFKFFLLLSFLAFFSSCAALQDAKVWQQPEASVSAVDIVALNFNSIELSVELDIFNPNPYGISFDALAYKLDIEGFTALSGDKEEKSTIAAETRQKLNLPLKLEFNELYKLIKDLKNKNSMEYAFSAKLLFELPFIGPFNLPVSFSGSLPLPSLPDLSVKELKLESISLAGASLLLVLKLKNPNDFSIFLEDFNYNLRLNDNFVAEGRADEKRSFNTDEENEIRLPLNLSFIQSGLALYKILSSGGNIKYNFGFATKLETDLSFLKAFPFELDKEGRIELSR